MPPESQLHRQVVRKRADARPVASIRSLRLYYVEVAEPDMHRARGDFERLAEALAQQWGLAGLDGRAAGPPPPPDGAAREAAGR